MPAAPTATKTLDEVPERLLGRVLLINGAEEFLNERAIESARAVVRRADAEAELSETTGDQLTLGTLGELSAPSLFSSTRFVLVRRVEDLPEESVEPILGYVASPVEDVALVLCHSGGQKGSGVLTKLRKTGVLEIRSAALKPSELPRYVVNEMRRHRARIEPDAAETLIAAVGSDLRGLAAACNQLASDVAVAEGHDGDPAAARGLTVTTELVRRYFGGRAEAKSFDIAEHALFGRSAQALEELRWGLSTGLASVLVTSAMGSGLRQVTKFGAAPRGRSEGEMAKIVGAPPWKLRILRNQLRGWDPDRLGAAIRMVARADADIKGRASDPSWTLEQLVLSVSGLVDTGR